MLARTQTKQDYGMFALSYSVSRSYRLFTIPRSWSPALFMVLERYRNRFSEYLRLMVRVNAFVGLALMCLVLVVCLSLYLVAPQYFSRALLGLGVTVGILLSGTFLRRVFYLQRQPELAARASLICFCDGCLWPLSGGEGSSSGQFLGLCDPRARLDCCRRWSWEQTCNGSSRTAVPGL